MRTFYMKGWREVLGWSWVVSGGCWGVGQCCWGTVGLLNGLSLFICGVGRVVDFSC